MFSNKVNTYIAKGVFGSDKLLYLVTGHEFIHAYHGGVLGINIFNGGINRAYSEASAYDWSIMAHKAIGYGNKSVLNSFNQGFKHFFSESGNFIPGKFHWSSVPGIIKR